MYKYQGLLIHQSYDDLGFIEVVDCDGIRSLHFGTAPRQSSMELAQPNQLYLTYARAMMTWLLFKPEAEQVLMMGLGGGSLTKYFLEYFPDCRLKVIEYRPQVIKVARKYFELPLDPRLKIKIADGSAYIKTQTQQQPSQHDLILIDAFNHEGMAEGISALSFFDDCKILLTQEGLLVINLWCSDKNLYTQLQNNLKQVFNHQVLFLPVPKRDNVIALAFNSSFDDLTLKELKIRAKSLEQHYEIEFPLFVKAFKAHNKHRLNQLLKP